MRLICTLYLLFLSTLASAQDVIRTKDGREVKAIVAEITTTEVKYRRFDNLNGPVYIIPKRDVSQLMYANGTTENLGVASSESYVSVAPYGQSTHSLTTTSTAEVQPTFSGVQAFALGEGDARIYYQNYKGAGTGTLIASLLSPLVGLIPAIACSATAPNDSNLGYPDTVKFQQLDYQNGYRQRAKKTKSGKVWTNWGIGLGVNLVLAIALASQ